MTAGCHQYLLPSEGDHVQRAVHETSHHHLGPVLREHGVIHTMVGCHILTEEHIKQETKTLLIKSLSGVSSLYICQKTQRS